MMRPTTALRPRNRSRNTQRNTPCTTWISILRSAMLHGCGVVFLIAGLGFASPARAEFELCNQTSYILRSAVAFREKGQYNTKGWWSLFPGECKTVIKSTLKQNQYYAYAEAAPEHKAGLNSFEGNREFCIDEGDFETIGNEDCTAQSLRAANFVEVKVDKSEQWTTAFTETAEFDLEHARIAGIQRLLTDLGYDPGMIDGFYGRKSRDAVIKFRVSEGKPASNLISDDLLVDLSNALKRDTAKFGFDLCNRSQMVVWTAMGFLSENNDWLSRGWWKVEPGACVKPIRAPLQRDEYYIYAATSELEQEIELTKSELNLCIADVKFEILGKDNCELRGYRSVAFEKVHTDGSTRWTQDITFTGAPQNLPAGSVVNGSENIGQ